MDRAEGADVRARIVCSDWLFLADDKTGVRGKHITSGCNTGTGERAVSGADAGFDDWIRSNQEKDDMVGAPCKHRAHFALHHNYRMPDDADRDCNDPADIPWRYTCRRGTFAGSWRDVHSTRTVCDVFP